VHDAFFLLAHESDALLLQSAGAAATDVHDASLLLSHKSEALLLQSAGAAATDVHDASLLLTLMPHIRMHWWSIYLLF
jgi:hypothetical protein